MTCGNVLPWEQTVVSCTLKTAQQQKHWTMSQNWRLIVLLNNNNVSTPLVVVKGSAFHASPYGPLRSNVTSSIKPEVHKISQRRQKRTEPQPQGILTENSWRSVQRFQRYALGQTDTQRDRRTDRQTNWAQYIPLPYRDEATFQCHITSRQLPAFDCTGWLIVSILYYL